MEIIRKGKGLLIDGMILLSFSWLLYALIFAPNGLPLYFQVKKLRDVQAKTLESIRYEQVLIQNNKVLLESDEEYFDKEARVTWGYVKPLEKIYWYDTTIL